MKKIYFVIFCLCIFVITKAATITWTGASGGTWSVAANWSSATVPLTTDDIIFNTSVTVVVDGTKTVNSLTVTNNATVIFQGTSSTVVFNLNCAGCTSTVDAGSTLTLAGTSASNKCDITLANTANFIVNGVLNLGISSQTATQRLLPVAGTVTTINGTINIAGSGTSVSGSSATNYIVNGIQEMKRNGGAFPVATYAIAARNIISGTVASLPTFTSSQTTTWGIIEFNAPGNTNTGTSGASLFAYNPICQDFKVINTGTGNCTIASSGSTARTVTVIGNLTVAAGAILNINSTTAAINATASGFDVKGDVTIDGTVTETGTATGSIITMSGTVAQAVAIAAISNDVSLRFNNAAGFLLGTNLTLPNTTSSKLVLTSGKINAGNNTIKLLSNSTLALTGGTLGAHVYNGSFVRNMSPALTYVFPVGKNTSYWPVKINNSEANEFTVKYISPNFNSSGPATSPMVLNNYWNITPTTAPGVGATADISLGYENTSAFLDFTKLHFLHSDDNLTWSDKSPGLANMTAGTGPGGCVASNTCGFLDITAYAGPFSPFAIGGAAGALPVTVEYINGTKQNNGNTINYKVNCTSSSSASLTVERSADGRNYIPLNIITASALRCQQPFEFTDKIPLAGYNYYRLKMTDENDKTTYSAAIVILNKENGFDITGLLPSLVNTKATLNVSAAAKMQMNIVVTDFSGRQVQTKSYTLIAGSNQLHLNFESLAAGAYQICGYSSQGKTKIIRFIKQ